MIISAPRVPGGVLSITEFLSGLGSSQSCFCRLCCSSIPSSLLGNRPLAFIHVHTTCPMEGVYLGTSTSTPRISPPLGRSFNFGSEILGFVGFVPLSRTLPPLHSLSRLTRDRGLYFLDLGLVLVQIGAMNCILSVEDLASTYPLACGVIRVSWLRHRGVGGNSKSFVSFNYFFLYFYYLYCVQNSVWSLGCTFYSSYGGLACFMRRGSK